MGAAQGRMQGSEPVMGMPVHQAGECVGVFQGVPENIAHHQQPSDSPLEGQIACISWFRRTFADEVDLKIGVPWAKFWRKMDETLRGGSLPYLDLWTYSDNGMFRQSQRQIFQQNITASSAEISYSEFRAVVNAHDATYLADLISDVMTSKWSRWLNGGQGWGEYTDMVLAPADQWIVKWRVGLATRTMQIGDVTKNTIVVEALQGVTNTGQALPTIPANHNEHPIIRWEVVECGDPALGFSHLRGQGSGWFTRFFDHGEPDVDWEVDAETDLFLPSGRVVGYQMRSWGPTDSARFLFKSFEDSKKLEGPSAAQSLQDQVFLSHTGADMATHRTVEMVSTMHTMLQAERVPAFLDSAALTPGSEWAKRIELSVQISRVVMIILSPSFCKRFWCMRELDLALNAPVGPNSKYKQRRILPVLLGLDHGFHKVELPTCRKEWQKFLEDPDKAPYVNIAQWEQNLQRLARLQALDANEVFTSTDKTIMSKVCKNIVDAVCDFVTPWPE